MIHKDNQWNQSLVTMLIILGVMFSSIQVSKLVNSIHANQLAQYKAFKADKVIYASK